MSTAAAPARSGAVLADLLPAARHRYAVDTALVVGGAALTGIAAQIAVPVPGSPVPVTGQTFAALLIGTALGARRGFLSLALYTLVGMAGMPWFSEGTSGPGGASFGYVLGHAARRHGRRRSRPPGRGPVRPAHRGHDGGRLPRHLRGRRAVPGALHGHVDERGRRGRSRAVPDRRRAQGRAGHGRPARLLEAGRPPG